MEIEGCQEIDLEFEGHDLIENYQFPETVDGKKEVNTVGIDVNDHLPELHESTEPERNQRNGRYNLRKSLAWDSAFFTSAGVLDPEELSSMIIRSDKKEHILPGIQEEITGSTESISTLRSDSLTLESGEDDLFLDIRASIQRSSKKASNLINSSTKIAAMVLDGPAISLPKKEDFFAQNKIPKPGVKKTSGLQTVRMSKSQLKPMGNLASERSIKQDSVRSQAGSIGKTGVTNSGFPISLKTMSSSVPSSTTAKQDSVGTGRIKPECGSSKQGSVSGKVTQLPKVSSLGGSRKVLPKPAVSSKCSSLGSSTTSSVHSTRSSTSSDNSINTSSGNATKPTLMAARRNLGKSINISTGPSGSIPKTPSRALPKNKLPASTLSTYLKSTKISSSVSPASSISEWSSVSSTTSSVVNQRSNNSRTSLDTSSCRSVDGDSTCLDPRDNVAGRKAERQGNQGATSNTSKKSSTSGTLQAPGKPSGLRLPSPKIGFFDGSISRTPNGNQRSQSALHPVIPKSGAAATTPTRSSNGKPKSAKVPTATRMATSSAKKKAGSPKAASPASSKQKSHALVKASSVSTDENDSLTLSLGVKVSGIIETYQEAVEVQAEDGVKQVVDAGTGADNTDNLGDSCLNKNMSSGDIKTASQIGDGLIKKDEVNENSVPTSESIEKENNPAYCQGEGLTGDMRAIYQKNRDPNSQLLSDTSECELSSTAAAFNATTCRPPIALKNFSCSDECVDKPTELVIEFAVAEDTGSAVPSSGTDGLIKKYEHNENSILTFEAVEKENNPANCQGEGLAGDKRGICPTSHDPNSQLLSDTLEHVLSSTAAASDAAACSDECVDKPTELVIQVVVTDDTNSALPSSGSEYISQIGDGLIKDKHKKNSVPISGSIEKENDPANCQGKGLTGDKRGIIYQKNYEPNSQLLIDTSECALSSTAAASEAAAYRSPFTLKIFSCNNDCVDKPTEPVITLKSFSCSNECADKHTEPVIEVAVAENTGFALPSSEEREFADIDL